MYLRHIPMDGPQNMRDLGGFPNRQGKGTVWNRLYRADSMSHLSKADIAKLKAFNIRTIIDLRGNAERIKEPDIEIDSIQYFSCPLMKEEIKSEEQIAQHSFMKSLAIGYQTMITEGSDLIAFAVRTVIEREQEGAVLFHCTAGKDRTGLLTAILLLILEVMDEDIIADYQVSHTYNRKGINKMVESLPQLKEFMEQAGEDSILHSHPKNIEKVLEYFKKERIQDWLGKNGVETTLLNEFRNRLLES